jgi:hypothetical protein
MGQHARKPLTELHRSMHTVRQSTTSVPNFGCDPVKLTNSIEKPSVFGSESPPVPICSSLLDVTYRKLYGVKDASPLVEVRSKRAFPARQT